MGTTNLDFRSLYLHFECGALLFGSSAIQDIKQDFLTTMQTCRPIMEGNLIYPRVVGAKINLPAGPVGNVFGSPGCVRRLYPDLGGYRPEGAQTQQPYSP